MENKIEKLIKEDLVNYKTHSAGNGYDWHNRTNPMQVSLIDILKSDRSTGGKANPALPHEIQSTFDNILAVSDKIEQLKGDIIKAYSNPIIKDDKRKKQFIKEMVNDLSQANKCLGEFVKKLDQLQM